jgi:hypothetical protein
MPVEIGLTVDLAEAIAKFVPPIKTAILKSLGFTENDVEEAIRAPDFAEILRKRLEEEPDLKPDVLLSFWIERTRASVLSQRKERLAQARTSFAVAIAALILGISLVLIGIILVFTVGLPVGIVTSASSIVTDIVSGLAFTFYREANNRLDENAKEMNVLDKASIAMDFISRITDIEKKDKAIEDLAKNLYLGK